jgi:hypothetical protein
VARPSTISFDQLSMKEDLAADLHNVDKTDANNAVAAALNEDKEEEVKTAPTSTNNLN